MVSRINLLPWREELRAEKQRRFISYSAGFWMLTALSVVMILVYFKGLVEDQNGRNKFLQTQISRADSEIKEIDKIRAHKQELIDRMDVIQQLQRDRTQIVRVFNDLVHKMPKGMYLTSMQRKGREMEIQGIAQSNARVSELMRNLDSSEWFASPDLDIINITPDESTRVSRFTLKANEPELPSLGDSPKG